MNYKFAELISTPSNNINSINEIYISQPDTSKEALAGKLFILLEIKSTQAKSIKLVNFLIDNLNTKYYQNEKILLREKIESLKVEHIFEACLAKINTSFTEFLKQERININISDINIIVGVIHEDTIYFASSGKNRIFLIHPGKDNEDYKIVDINKNGKEDDVNKKTNKLFPAVLSGKFPKKGVLVVTNEALPEYISNKQLIDISTTLPPSSAVEQIKQIVSGINSYVPFLSIIIKSTSAQKVKQQKQVRESTNKSIVNLNRTAESTEHLLMPSGMKNFKKWFKPFFNFSKKIDTPGSLNQPKLVIKDKILVKKNTFFTKFINSTKKITSTLSSLLIYTVKLLFRREKSFLRFNSFGQLMKAKILNFKNKIKNLKKLQKILLILILLIILIFFYSLREKKQQKTILEENNQYEEISSMIEQKQNQADANMLYSNEEGAKKLFDEIKELLNQLPQNNEEQRQKYDDFKKKFHTQLEQIQRVYKPTDLKEIANFHNLDPQIKNLNMVYIKDLKKIYSANSDQGSIYVLDISDNTITTIASLKEDLNSLYYPVVTKNNNIYYFNQDNIIEFNTGTNELSTLNIVLGERKISDLAVYNNRLYLLDTKNSQILRYNRNADSFSSPYAWLSEQVDLSASVEMAIDGNVYVLDNKGKMIQFLRGKQTDFKLENIDPPLNSAQSFFLPQEDDLIFIADKETGRIIVYQKDGQFLLQYKADEFKNITALAADMENNIIYVLSDNSIYSFAPKEIKL